ncbi:kinase non-catalytic C-lobe domain-containing protein 1 [Periophthalmus magnuspinnatus]|uniref:kinase non-catalytic C-lobe domain-containing protein 1 n=1 Tax=Periophthalmus magnuspinnatus TaxID=409849 RepID=UPI00145C06D0|nr:kinase non-catalytic C-lobe domain-containing protein 1 [Periophthalmus magnuspinnatus]
MEKTRNSDAGVTYLGKADEIDGVYDLEHLEHLPPLLEDEENVSLADILSLRDTCLLEDEVWAMCGECALALQSISQSQLFHSLCITPDTLAFNAHGNVCFMEQLSDDPEGSFVPPEFDSTGSTFEGHVFSLGSTLSAALSFVIEPELESDLGPELSSLLEQMQQEQPEDRPALKDVLSLAQSHLSHTSSAAVCRRLSSAGRRVLSIESFQDGAEGSWEARWQHPKPRCLLKGLSSEENDKNLSADSPIKTNGLSRQQVCTGWDSSLWAEDMDSGIGHSMNFRDELDFRSFDSSPVMRRSQARCNRIRGALNRSCSVPDSNNPPLLSPKSCGDISIPVSDLSEIGGDEDQPKSTWKMERLNRGSSCECYTVSTIEDYMNSTMGCYNSRESLNEPLHIEEVNREEDREEEGERDLLSLCNSCQDLEQDSCGNSLNNGLCTNNHMTKSMLCLNEESQDEWISLRELLTRCGRRLSVNELWALCYTCLSSLQTYIDFPAYLSLDTVFVGCEGEVLFLKPKNIGYCDEFYLAPEYQEHGIVTEKVCIYGIAAILWATAKFNLSANQKLAMPRKLKRLLLEMAKRTPIERPTIATAKKTCRDYLSRQGTSAETVWDRLIQRVHKPVSKYIEDDLKTSDSQQLSNEDSAQLNGGFVPMATESRLAPVPGPIPHSYPVVRELQLPEAFTSTATHFTPIILTNQDAAEKSPSVGDELEGYMEGLIDSSENIEEIGLDSSSIPEDPPVDLASCPTAKKLHCSPKNTTITSANTPPNDPPPVTFDPTVSEVSHIEVSLPSSLNSNLNNCGVFNNYLFRQDPKTGQLYLVPVQIRAPDSVPGLDINLSLVPPSLKGLLANSQINDSTSFNAPPLDNNCSFLIDNKSENGQAKPSRQTSASMSPEVHPALQEVIDLLKGEFTLNSGLDNGHEDIAMGEYIFSLKELEFSVFADVVRQRFSDLYWDEDLLGVLHCLVNYSSVTIPYRSSNEQAASKAVKRASRIEVAPPGGWREDCRELCLDLNGNIHTTAATDAEDTWDQAELKASHGQANQAEDDELGAEQRQRGIFQGISTDSSDTGLMEGGEHSAGGSDESPSEAELALGRDEASMDLEDSDSGASDRRLSPGTVRGFGAEGAGPSLSSAWDLAFYEEQCFSEEVVKYAVDLGQHTGGAACVDVKTQEVQQQLVIETRNLKKTRNFYHKLLQQERKNKGSDNKAMLSKLKSQLEELRSRVIFLESVKKYLEVLSIDQWGLEVSLLPSLADCGADGLELQASEDSSVLSFNCCKGRSTLQLGSPLGLMAYLFARNAAMEGYIQQFLYTFRYFCTPEELLQFLMDKYMSAAREGPDLSGDSLKVFHRSLDLLQLWVSPCKDVDFTGRSSLMETLENFIITQVIPVDSRGEALLSALHSSTHTTSAQDRGSQLSLVEEDDLVCLHSSTEDLGKRWRISRVVEPSPSLPKDKSFSISAALPVPCYASLFEDLPSASVHAEERLPFCQSEYSPQHLAQQLTLIEQEIFRRCHPVHFLNSRTQGVTDNALSTNKNVSSPVCPAEGSGALSADHSSLHQLLLHSDRVSHWVCAEVVLCDSVKTQVALLTKYLWIGKHCYESRNFATAMQILGGLENVIVRQLPAWKHLPTKVCEILEELRAVQVFLKSDDLCLMGGDHMRRRPTLPSAHILALHIQQLEIGAFKLTTGAYKWNKLRRIAKVVSQVHAFQEAVFPYSPDRDLQSYLRVRITRMGSADIHQLASGNQANFQQTSERQARRIHDTLRRVKASFQ